MEDTSKIKWDVAHMWRQAVAVCSLPGISNTEPKRSSPCATHRPQRLKRICCESERREKWTQFYVQMSSGLTI